MSDDGDCCYPIRDKPTPPPDAQAMTREDVIEGLVNKFLAWPLPESVCSDLCATKRGYPHRSGTTLMTATEAKQMVEHLLVDVFASAESFDRLVASQRETIRRLERERDGWKEQYEACHKLHLEAQEECEKANTFAYKLELASLQARLTASEAKHKWTTQPTHDGWHWWRRPYGKKILVTIVRVKKNWGNGKLYVYAGKRTEDCKGSWQGPLTPGEE